MRSDLTRDFSTSLSIRSDGEGRTIHGIVVPYGEVADVRDGHGPNYRERFQRGAFAKTLRDRRGPVKLLSQHDPHNPMGVAVDMREDDAGLYGAFRVSNTAYANDQLELARDGVLDSFSVGFAPIASKKDSGVTVRTEVALREVSLVTFPAYSGALVSGIRSLERDLALSDSQVMLLSAVLAQLADGDAALDPFVDALCAADNALDAAQMVIAEVLGVPDPDPADPADEGDMQMSSALTSLARRLNVAAARVSPPLDGAGKVEPLSQHSSRALPPKARIHAALITRGISHVTPV